MLKGKNILVGITGGIAAYKICELIRMYKRANANVKVVVTPNALNFVTKLTLQTLSQNNVALEQFEITDFKPEHISYADEADIFVIAPATANTISKIANGICDNLLTLIAAAFKKPIIIAPAMNTNMWNNPFVQENLQKLINNGFINVAPENGYLACGANGEGRLAAIDKIFDKTAEVLISRNQILKGKKVIVTAGGTIEDIDPVRFISNYSSGKMGIAIADESYRQGARTVLITSKDVEKPYDVIKVKSAQDMQKAINHEFKNADYIFMAAAIADFRVKNFNNQKIKKTDTNEMTLELVKNPDILKEICGRKKSESSGSVIVGFCAETENLIDYAKKKIIEKGCDFIVANDVSRKDIGFSSDENEVFIIDKHLNIKKLEKEQKSVIAKKIIGEIYEQSGNLQLIG